MNAHDENNRAAWLDGPSSKCSVLPEPAGPAWRLVLMGAPGVGKGTQAVLLGRHLGACHLSTGDVFRAAKNQSDSNRSPAMTAALAFMRRGELVPDATVWELVRERVGCLQCQGGFVLDGFPRTLAQAISLRLLLESKRLPLHAVLNFELPVAEIVSRLSGRRTCERCKSVFHVSAQPPQNEGLCDHCDGRLYQREDDHSESIAVRLETYERSTAPLIHYYERLGLLTPMVARGSPEEIVQRTIAALETRRNAQFSDLDLRTVSIEP